MLRKREGRQHFTQAICSSHIVHYMHPEIPAGFVEWWEQQELCKGFRIMLRTFVLHSQRSKLTYFVLTVFWQTWLQLSNLFNYRILANLGSLASLGLDTEIGMILRLFKDMNGPPCLVLQGFSTTFPRCGDSNMTYSLCGDTLLLIHFPGRRNNSFTISVATV